MREGKRLYNITVLSRSAQFQLSSWCVVTTVRSSAWKHSDMLSSTVETSSGLGARSAECAIRRAFYPSSLSDAAAAADVHCAPLVPCWNTGGVTQWYLWFTRHRSVSIHMTQNHFLFVSPPNSLPTFVPAVHKLYNAQGVGVSGWGGDSVPLC